MPTFRIEPISRALVPDLQRKIDSKTKPQGSLGRLERLALQIGCIQNTLSPALSTPVMLVFAGDHGISSEGVSPFPQAVTAQMVLNFLAGGAAINVFARQSGFGLKVVDAGVNADLPAHPDLIPARIDKGTRNFLVEPAMSREQCQAAIQRGAALAQEIAASGSNVIGFGEMGIGNTSSAALLMHFLSDAPLAECVGRGTGLDDAGLQHKRSVLTMAAARHAGLSDPLEVLAAVGGFEIAMMVGAMLGAAEKGMILLIDGFIVTAALLVASKVAPSILEYCVFSHRSRETGHARLLDYLQAEPLLDLDLRLGEGTGAALSYPLVAASVAFLNEMASFESAGVSNRQ